MKATKSDPYWAALELAHMFSEPLPAGFYPQPRPPEPRSIEDQAADAAWDTEQDNDNAKRVR